MKAIAPRQAVFSLLFLTAATFVSGPAWSQAVIGSGTLAAEATIFENESGNNGGGYDNICAGNLMTSFMTRRGLIRYDLPDIPPGATVTRVSLAMQQDRVRFQGPGAPKSATIELRRVTGDWSEGNGGGNLRACGGGTNVAGVDWDGQPAVADALSASEAVDASDGLDFLFDSATGTDDQGLVEDVQAWVDGADNFGWAVSVADEGDADNARLLELGQLDIEWTEADEPAFVINPGLNDAWFNPETAGQGLFFMVFPDVEVFFLSWFTYEVERPGDDASATLGEAGHRWLTAQGGWDGDTATLDAVLTTGGVFDSANPAAVPEAGYGTIEVRFLDCNSAEVSYDLPGPGLSGVVPVQRVVTDNVPYCESFQPDGTN